jgi:hypothetical protein
MTGPITTAGPQGTTVSAVAARLPPEPSGAPGRGGLRRLRRADEAPQLRDGVQKAPLAQVGDRVAYRLPRSARRIHEVFLGWHLLARAELPGPDRIGYDFGDLLVEPPVGPVPPHPRKVHHGNVEAGVTYRDVWTPAHWYSLVPSYYQLVISFAAGLNLRATFVTDGLNQMPDKITPAPGGDEDALARLRLLWGDSYRVWWEPGRGWVAARLDGQGEDITAGDPGMLEAGISLDYAARPVRFGDLHPGVSRDLPGWS